MLFLSACASIPADVTDLQGLKRSVELRDTPFFPQRQFQCGPAALATVLSSSGATVDLQELVDRVYLPGKRGSLQVEMLAATRTAGRLPYVIDGTLQVLWDELSAGRPVIVLQNLGVAAIPRWHFAVVIGIDAERDRVILRSGVDQRRLTSLTTFLRTWRRSNFWGFVVLRPTELPTRVDRLRYLKSIAALEKAGRSDAAVTAWRTALKAWTNDPVALFGLGNTSLAAGDNVSAETYFRTMLESNPGPVAARNNLAMALARQHRFEEARHEITTALKVAADPELERELRDTEALIAKMSQEHAGQEDAARQDEL